jgi:2-methylcitrate dehydratase PrpD
MEHHLSVTQHLAHWALGLDAAHVPELIRQRAQTCFLDTVGVAIAGSETRVGALARKIGLQGDPSGHSTVFCGEARSTATAAAFINGTCAHALDFDDNCYAGVVHGSAVIAPAALAIAQLVDATGQEMLTAFIAGSECEYALGAASQNVLYAKGWWTTGVLGPIGAAVAASCLLKLDIDQMTSALGLAIAGTGGSKACFGTDAKPLLAGRASEAGVVCALMAKQGATGPIQAVESSNGFINLFNQGTFDIASIHRLGKSWFAQSPGVDIKRIPVCLSSHAAIDAVLELVLANKISLDLIECITCDVPPMVRRNLVYDQPQTVQQSQFSMPFAMAISLMYGTLTMAHLNETLLQDKALTALMSRVHMTTSSLWDDKRLSIEAPEGAGVEVLLTNGQTLQTFRALPRGSVAFPLTFDEIKRKFFGCVEPVFGCKKTQVLFSTLGMLDGQETVRTLFNGLGRP